MRALFNFCGVCKFEQSLKEKAFVGLRGVNSRAVEFCEDGVPATGCEKYFLSGSRYAAVWREIHSVSKVSICWKSAGLVKR
jgi:hypothetical protein